MATPSHESLLPQQPAPPQPFKLENEWKSGASQSVSRSVALGSNSSAATIRSSALSLVRKMIKEFRNEHASNTAASSASPTVDCITYLSLTGTNFEEVAGEGHSISSFFSKATTSLPEPKFIKLSDQVSKSPQASPIAALEPVVGGIRRFMAKVPSAPSSPSGVVHDRPAEDQVIKNDKDDDGGDDDDEVIFVGSSTSSVIANKTSALTSKQTLSKLGSASIDPSVYEALPANIRAEIDNQLIANNRSNFSLKVSSKSKTIQREDPSSSKVARISTFFTANRKQSS